MTKNVTDILWNEGKVNQQKSDFVDKRLEEFFSKESDRYRDLDIFKEIFSELDDEDFIRNYYYHYLCEDKRVRDLYCSMMTAIEEGEIQGREEGYKEGIEIGRKEGIAIGKHKSALKIAKKMKDEGDEIMFISEVTGLTIEEIKKL